jgi:hypothetical protein
LSAPLIPLDTYLEAAARAGETPDLAWERLEAFLASATTEEGWMLDP